MTQKEKASLIQGLIEIEHKQLRGAISVSYDRRSPWLYAAHKGQGGVVLECGVALDHPRFMQVIHRAAMSSLEVLRGTTLAVEVRMSSIEETV